MGKPNKALQRGGLRSAMLVAGVVLLIAMGSIAATLLWDSKGSSGNPTTAGGQTVKGTPSEDAAAKLPKDLLRLVAKALDPEAMEHSLPEGSQFSPDFKNPCWKVGDTLRCLPYAYVLGNFQAGGNTLFTKLSEHPDVVTNDVSRWQFWAEDVKQMSGYVDKHSSGNSIKAVQQGPKDKVILDGSASTFAFYWSAGLRAHRAFQRVMVPCWRECSEGSKGKKEALHQCTADNCYGRAMAADVKVAASLNVTHDQLHLPLVVSAAYGGQYKPKLIILVRNPVDRVHCAYWQYPHYNGKYGKSAEGFVAYVKEQVGALKACTLRFVGKIGGDGQPMNSAAAERHCALYFEALGNKEEQIFFHADQFLRGMYSIYLEVWLRHFPRDSVLLLRAEDYFADQEKTLKQVFTFLGLSSLTDEQMKKVVRAGRPNSVTKTAPKMLPEAENILLDLYRPYNQKLSYLMNDLQWLHYNDHPAEQTYAKP